MERRFLVVLSTAILGGLLTGCGGTDRPQMAPVTGRVTYQGKPVAGADVSFMSPASPRVAAGRTNSEGQYKLSTFNTGDGAVLGEHVVTISKAAPTTGAGTMSADNPGADYDKAMKEAAKAKPKVDSELPAKYADPKESGLTRSVIAGDINSFNFDLE